MQQATADKGIVFNPPQAVIKESNLPDLARAERGSVGPLQTHRHRPSSSHGITLGP
jgi:hypothetical protein